MNPSALLEVFDYSAGYRGRPAFKPISFCLPISGTVILRGTNGSGKSTFFRSLIGQAELTTGNLYVNGRKQKPDLNNALSAGMAYMPQEDRKSVV